MARITNNSNFTPAFDINSRTITIRKKVESNPNYKPSEKEVPWDTLEEAFTFLIEMRALHCEEQLAKATANGETWIDDEYNPQIIFFPGGHFSIPVYEAMIDYLHNGHRLRTQMPSLLICQQALRCYMDIAHQDDDGRCATYQHLRNILGKMSIREFECYLTEFLAMASIPQ